jgi:hypothetical protein
MECHVCYESSGAIDLPECLHPICSLCRKDTEFCRNCPSLLIFSDIPPFDEELPDETSSALSKIKLSLSEIDEDLEELYFTVDVAKEEILKNAKTKIKELEIEKEELEMIREHLSVRKVVSIDYLLKRLDIICGRKLDGQIDPSRSSLIRTNNSLPSNGLPTCYFFLPKDWQGNRILKPIDNFNTEVILRGDGFYFLKYVTDPCAGDTILREETFEESYPYIAPKRIEFSFPIERNRIASVKNKYLAIVDNTGYTISSIGHVSSVAVVGKNVFAAMYGRKVVAHNSEGRLLNSFSISKVQQIIGFLDQLVVVLSHSSVHLLTSGMDVVAKWDNDIFGTSYLDVVDEKLFHCSYNLTKRLL